MLVLTIGIATAVAGTGAWWFFQHNKEGITVAPVHTPKPETRSLDKMKKAPRRDPAVEVTAAAMGSALPPKPESVAKPAAPKPAAAKPTVAKVTEPKAPGMAVPVVALATKPASPAKTEISGGRGPETLVVESFGYASGTDLQGQKAGRGWLGSWETRGARLRDTSLNYPGHKTSGGSMVLPAGNETVTARRVAGPVSRMLSDSKKQGHWYFSALISHPHQAAGSGGEVRVYPLDPGDRGNGLHITLADTGAGLRISLAGAQAPVVIPNSNDAVLLVCRIDVTNPNNGRWDLAASLLVNPSLERPGFKEAGKPMKMEAKGAVLPVQTGVLIRKEPGLAETTIDEVRFSEHWADICFRPPKLPPPVKAAAM
jgi:hypothetical protein